eukprot:TRINITY_DN78175_c0_g1_i1.p1 TRINITY_DN78175_c0_g1~~TRINITY_DN78175_c0_g1_i1.p1  ORF type:complete len:605 (+),score=92.73 TRINITY_DN78175_c0_g1_i1:63-1817(+)
MFLRTLLAVGAVGTATSANATTATAGKNYNILFLMCDSMDGRVLDPTSPISTYLEMPYMWSMASQGINFVRHYANNPQCAPSRTSMFTGRHTHEIKAWSNEIAIAATPGSGDRGWELDPACLKQYDTALCQHFAEQQNVSATFPDTLKAQGVDVMLFGKVDVGGNIMNRPDQRQYRPWAPGFHPRSLMTAGRAADIRKATQMRPVAQEHVPTAEIQPRDWKTIAHCMDWLEKNERASGTWMLYCSILMPHPPYECNPDTEARVSDDVGLPDWFTDPAKFPESRMHPYDSYMSFSKGMMDEQGNFSRKQLEANMRCWYAMANQTDQMLGQVWAKAGETGNLDNTIVIFTSDHGEMHMEHRQHLKNSMYEGSARVPLIIAGPGSKPGLGSRSAFQSGKIVKDLTSLLDMYPTFVDATGGTPPGFLSGFSLMPYLRGTGQRPEKHIVAMYMSNMANTNAFMIRQGPWKYFAYGQYGPSWYKTYHPQLFNLDVDPLEQENVLQANAEVAKELDDILRSVVDYVSVDREVKMQERMIYDRYYMPLGKMQLHKEWQNAYDNFDEGDLEKVRQWYEATASAPQPKEPLLVV